jgi:hypothetical protein
MPGTNPPAGGAAGGGAGETGCAAGGAGSAGAVAGAGAGATGAGPGDAGAGCAVVGAGAAVGGALGAGALADGGGAGVSVGNAAVEGLCPCVCAKLETAVATNAAVDVMITRDRMGWSLIRWSRQVSDEKVRQSLEPYPYVSHRLGVLPRQFRLVALRLALT